MIGLSAMLNHRTRADYGRVPHVCTTAPSAVPIQYLRRTVRVPDLYTG